MPIAIVSETAKGAKPAMMRSFLAALLFFLSLAGPAAAGEAAAFRIYWKGQPVGFHLVNVNADENGVRVETRIEMRIKFGPIPVYRYTHHVIELWRDGELQFLASVTNDDGKEMSAGAWREGGLLIIDGEAFSGAAPEGAVPASCWNRSLLKARTLFSTTDGEIVDVRVTNLGEGIAPHGEAAEHFRLSGTLDVDLWFDGEQWVGSHFVVDGETFTYEPIKENEARVRLYAMLD